MGSWMDKPFMWCRPTYLRVRRSISLVLQGGLVVVLFRGQSVPEIEDSAYAQLTKRNPELLTLV